jgi:hypothetical protein
MDSPTVFEQRLANALAAYTDRIAEPFDPDTITERVIAGSERRRLPWSRSGPVFAPLSLLVVVMLLVAMAIATIVLSQPRDPERPAWPLGLVIAGRGVTVASPAGSVVLASDDMYETIEWAIPDQRGGLIFQHTVTPPPWPQGAILWLRAGSDAPEPLVAEPEAWPVGVATSRQGEALFIYISGGETVVAVNLEQEGVRHEVADLPGSMAFGSTFAHAGGEGVAMIRWQEDGCVTATLVRADDGAVLSTLDECLPGGPLWGHTALGLDGRTLGIWDYETARFLAVDLVTGELRDDQTMSAAPPDVVVERPISSPGGWSLLAGRGSQVLLLDLSGSEVMGLPAAAGLTGGTTPYFEPFQLPAEATLGSGSEELPCQPTAGHLADQDLPAPVASTRQIIFDLASSCAYHALAELALSHETHLDPEGWCCPPADEITGAALARTWVAQGRSREAHGADGVRLPEPLTMLAQLLGTTPVHVADAADLEWLMPAPEGQVWVWPAVALEPGEDAWAELVPILEADVVEALRGGPVGFSGTPYLEYRIGISDDGTWRFALSGEYGP